MSKSLIMVLVLLQVGLAATLVQAQQRVPFRGLPWGAPPGPADPLEPWSLAPQSIIRPTTPDVGAGIALTPTPTQPVDPGIEAPPDVAEFLDADSTVVDATLIVVLHQVFIESPHQARQLRDLFDAGVDWSSAHRLLKLGAVKEYFREYAVEDLAEGMAAEIAALPDSSWSSGHPWRGRTMFFEVLARAERSRSSLPELGQGLDASERARLSLLHPKLRQPVVRGSNAPPVENELVQVVLERQEPATFPEEATMDGEVTLLVFIGRSGDVTRVTVEKSTSVVFEQAAIDAARRSLYRSANRGGVPEPSTIRITYPFRVPGPASPPANQP